ncbi:acyl-[acyl-carrier-protein]-phospholipid O-acyltransferase/long-chain-fatty-acid--[acyl-carrier-protein] ligase [Paenibacillus sp. 1182]|uniref:AMP-binding protein n=1 Tax=Paenibacillus sp. 1182 TaxID=2806565 RepID=UPI001AE39C18|nr:AMP-binding protein [Paenibacillus sp. 1182]MBP1309157.1 acyl-[acyl-carrier-protein]-phospholipid O-acyltransferase/long-chain-fatty-acid--[acyl-carrier-protein] ligase [Paenibacillus sp. 1182]
MIPIALLKTFIKCDVFHKERLLQNNKPCIYMPNHTSLLDAVLLSMHLPKDVVFVANTMIASKYSWALQGRETISVDPMNPYSIRSMIKVLRSGKSLVIFPEGRITITNSLMKVYPGVGYISIKTGAALVPIAIDGGEKTKKLTYLEGKIPTQWFPRTTLYIGKPFHLPEMKGLLMREKKEWGSHLIYRKLQETLLKCRMLKSEHLAEVLRKRVQEAPDMVIAEDPTGKMTMKKLWQSTIGISHLLDRRLRDEERLGLLLPTSIAGMVGLFAAIYSGRTPAMLNASMDTDTFCTCLRIGEIKTILTSRTFIEKGRLEYLIEAVSKEVQIMYFEDLKVEINGLLKLKVLFKERHRITSPTHDILLFTSGSEGTPKGVLLTHRNIYANIQQSRLMVDLTSEDRIMNALPMFHSFGLILTFLSPLCHVPIYMIPSPLMYKAIPEWTYDRKGTILFGTSTFLAAYGRYAHPYDFHRLRYVYAGAEKLQESVKSLWFEKFGIRVLEGYGLTETAPILALQTPMLYKSGSVGCLVPGVKHRIEPVEGISEGGRLQIQAPNLMRGYLMAEEGFVPAPEWFDTGDIVKLDGKGFVEILGRAKRFVKIGGEMVSLAVVEHHAKQAIGEGTVVAVSLKDERKGERIELVATSEHATKEKIRLYWRAHNVSPLALPTTVHVIKEIPMLGSGKADIAKVNEYIQSLYAKGGAI